MFLFYFILFATFDDLHADYSWMSFIPCLFSECCVPNSKWIPMDTSKLESDLKRFLHGQHLVELVLIKNLKFHITDENPSRSLVLSFHGMPGIGKSFVSEIIANNLYKNGMKSIYVHKFVANVDFLIGKELDEYKNILRKKIVDAIKQCPYSLFIFDEVHLMPENLLNVLKPFVDSFQSIDGVDFRKAIFILKSNSGSLDINARLVKAYKEGKARESLTIEEMENVLEKNVYYLKKDELQKCQLISHKLNTAFIPFFPLEKKHVRLCIKDYLKSKAHSNYETAIDKIIDSIPFYNLAVLPLAKFGCRDVEASCQRYI